MKTGKIQYVAAMNRTEKIDQYQEGIYNSAIAKESFIFGIEEVKSASKSSDTSDTTNVALYAVGVAGMMIRNRMHKSN